MYKNYGYFNTPIKIGKGLLSTLICCACLFIFAQLALLTAEFKANGLADSLVSPSLKHSFHYPVIWHAWAFFILGQMLVYTLLIAWAWWVSMSVGAAFRLSNREVTRWGCFFWLAAICALVCANTYFFASSFFAKYWLQVLGLSSKLNFILLMISTAICVFATLSAFFISFKQKRFTFLAYFFFLFALLQLAVIWYDKAYFSLKPMRIADDRPNVIIIGIDSLRPEAIAEHAPHLRYFLNTATVFPHAYTPLARTFPAWMSVLTAKYPLHHYARENLSANPNIALNDNIAKRLQAAGYQTMYASDEKRFSNITQAYGFDKIVGAPMGLNDFILGSLSDFPVQNIMTFLPISRFLFPYQIGNRAAALTYRPQDFMRELKQGLATRGQKPLFLSLHLCLSHWPYRFGLDKQADNLLLSQRYYHSVNAVDEQFQQVLLMLNQAGLLEHSLVFVMSDHGTTLGLPNDRLLDEANYVGDKKLLKKIAVYKKEQAPDLSFDMQHDYTINTSYGQGTDVLSLKQYQVLLAVHPYGMSLKAKRVQGTHSLLDIAPTILDILNLPPLANADGISFVSDASRNQAFFIETGDKLAEIEKPHIHIEAVLKQQASLYDVNKQTGLVFVDPDKEKEIIQAKQRAVIKDNWLLAYYPAEKRLVLAAEKNQMVWKQKIAPAYFVLYDLNTNQWEISKDGEFSLAASANNKLQALLTKFYGQDLNA